MAKADITKTKDIGSWAEQGLPRNHPARHSTPVPAATLPVPSWDAYPVLTELDFGALVLARTNIKEEIEFRTQKLKELDLEIQSAMAVAGAEKVTWEGRPVQVVKSRSGSKIVAEKLLMAGVPAQTIADATEPGKEYSYLLVGKPGK